MTPDGVRIELHGPRDHERTQVGDEEAALRESAHQALREAGLLVSRSASRRRAQVPFSVTANDSASSARRHRRSRGSVGGRCCSRRRRPRRRHRARRRSGSASGCSASRRHAPARHAEARQRRARTRSVFAADGTAWATSSRTRSAHPGRASTRSPSSSQNATVAIEDEHFYEHSGIDYSAIVRAALGGPQGRRGEQGGSTITQQLVRNLYIADPQDDDPAQDQRGEDGDGVRGRSTRRSRSSPST